MMNTYQDEERQLFEASSNSRSFMNPKVVGGLALVLAASATAGAFAGSSSSGVGKLSTSLVREDPIPDVGSYDRATCKNSADLGVSAMYHSWMGMDMACVCDVATAITVKSKWFWKKDTTEIQNIQKVSCGCIDDEVISGNRALVVAKGLFNTLVNSIADETKRIEDYHKDLTEAHAQAVAFDDARASAHAETKSSLESDIHSIKDAINDLVDKLEADPFSLDILSDYKNRVDQYYLKTGELADLLNNEPQATAGELQTLSQLKATMAHNMDYLCTDGRNKLAAWKLAAENMATVNDVYGRYCRQGAIFGAKSDSMTYERSYEAIIAEDVNTSDPTNSERAQFMRTLCTGHR